VLSCGAAPQPAAEGADRRTRDLILLVALLALGSVALAPAGWIPEPRLFDGMVSSHGRPRGLRHPRTPPDRTGPRRPQTVDGPCNCSAVDTNVTATARQRPDEGPRCVEFVCRGVAGAGRRAVPDRQHSAAAPDQALVRACTRSLARRVVVQQPHSLREHQQLTGCSVVPLTQQCGQPGHRRKGGHQCHPAARAARPTATDSP